MNWFAGIASGLLIALGACSDGQPSNDAALIDLPTRADTIDVQAKAIAPTKVEFIVSTTIPLPIEVMASVNLVGQSDDDVWIGHSDRVSITTNPTTFVLDTSAARTPLPEGNYEAEVSFYNRWGADKNPAAKASQDVKASVPVSLAGSGQTAEKAVAMNEKQRWVMNEVVMRTPWNEAEFTRRLGASQKLPSNMSHLHDAYYYPDADMTLIVNRLRNEVTVWRMGKETE